MEDVRLIVVTAGNPLILNYLVQSRKKIVLLKIT